MATIEKSLEKDTFIITLNKEELEEIEKSLYLRNPRATVDKIINASLWNTIVDVLVP